MQQSQQQTDVEQLDNLLLQRKITKPRFKFWAGNRYLTYDEAVKVLTTAVKVEIENRHFTPQLQDYMTYIEQVAQFFTEPGTKFGLTLMGLPGNGKSTMARAIAAVIDSIADLAIINERSGSKAVMVTAKQLVRYYRTHPDQWENLCFKPFLIIDDFGEEPVEVVDYGNVINPVIDLLSRRYDMQKLTILTTNATNLQIRKTYGDRIADRFNEMMKVVVFTNPSYRK